MSFYNCLLRPVLFNIQPETAHHLAVSALRYAPFLFKKRAPVKLPVKLWGREFPSPIGLAAGFDKDAEAWRGLSRLGFGFVELGTVTPKPQSGNAKPRIFRDQSTQSIINRMGFPGKGVEYFKRALKKRANCPVPLGINIGKNKDTETQEDILADYKTCLHELRGLADYFVVNVSSPNTPGLRALQGAEALRNLVSELMLCKEKDVPLLVKLAPDLSENELQEIAEVILEIQCDGVILSNTTLERPDVLPDGFASEQGGLSGPLLKEASTRMIAQFYQMTKGKVPIIGVGGVSSGQDVYDKMVAGASLVQVYTGFVFGGPALVAQISRELQEILAAEGIENCADIIGIDSDLSLR